MKLYKRHETTHVPISDPAAPGWRAEAPYYVRFYFRRRQYLLCLHTSNKGDALKRAKRIKDDVIAATLAGNAEAVSRALGREPAPPCSTLKELHTAYERAPLPDCSPDSRRQNLQALARFAKLVLSENGDQHRLDFLSRSSIEKWFADVGRRESAVTDQADRRRVRVSAQSDLRKVAAIFTPTNLPLLRTAGVRLPASLDEFLKAYREYKLSIPRKDYQAPPDAVIDATLDAWLRLGREEFITVGLICAFGLRKGEILQARWDWITEQNGHVMLNGSAHVKNGTGAIRVQALNPFFDAMMLRVEREQWKTGDLMLTAERGEATFRAVGDWLTNLGWDTTKKSHALRAYAGCLVAKCFTLLDARDFCRHADVTTTQNFYGHFLSQWRMIRPEDMRVMGQPIGWARAAVKEFQPRVVNA